MALPLKLKQQTIPLELDFLPPIGSIPIKFEFGDNYGQRQRYQDQAAVDCRYRLFLCDQEEFPYEDGEVLNDKV
jgi:hypothetical protein